MRQTLSLVIALAATLMGAVSAQAQITWTRQTSGYPTLSHTDGRTNLLSYQDSVGNFVLTGAWTTTPSGGSSFFLDRVAGVGSAGLLSGFPVGGIWEVDVFSSASAMANNSSGDLGHLSATLMGSPISFGSTSFSGSLREAFYVSLDLQGDGILLPSTTSVLVSAYLREGQGIWSWAESDIASGFASDLVKASSLPGQINPWTNYGPPTGVAALDVGFVQAVPEPATCLLLASGVVAFMSRKRRNAMKG